VIRRTIDWCAENRFLVFAGVLLLVGAGIWSLGRIPLDALPDISDVQVIVHTNWEGEPPSLIEDQVTYPIVTALLAAPHVKAGTLKQLAVSSARRSADSTRSIPPSSSSPPPPAFRSIHAACSTKPASAAWHA